MRKFSVFMMALSGLFLFACSSGHPEGKPLPGFNFEYMDSFTANVANVEVLNHYGAAKPANDASAVFVMPPDETFKKYLESRYKPHGARGRLVFEITEASVYNFNQEAASKMVRWMDMGGHEEYNLTLKVHVRAFDIPGYNEMGKVITANRRVKMSEHSSVAEREKLQFEALEKAIHDIDAAVQKTIRQDFGL